MFVPKEIGEFFKRATSSMDGVDATVREFGATANELRELAKNVNDEVAEWRRLRQAVQAALGQAAKRDA